MNNNICDRVAITGLSRRTVLVKCLVKGLAVRDYLMSECFQHVQDF